MVTSGGSASVEVPEFNWVNTALRNVKNTLLGTYHAVRFRHLPRRGSTQRGRHPGHQDGIREIRPGLMLCQMLKVSIYDGSPPFLFSYRTVIFLLFPRYSARFLLSGKICEYNSDYREYQGPGDRDQTVQKIHGANSAGCSGPVWCGRTIYVRTGTGETIC